MSAEGRATRRDLSRRREPVSTRVSRSARPVTSAARSGRRVSDDADGCVPRCARAGRDCRSSRSRASVAIGYETVEDLRACTAASTRRPTSVNGIVHTHSTHLVALTLEGVWRHGRRVTADHAVLRDESRPHSARAVPSTGRRRRRRVREARRDRTSAACSWSVWARSCGSRSVSHASYALEELEETARLWLMTGRRVAPLTEAALERFARNVRARAGNADSDPTPSCSWESDYEYPDPSVGRRCASAIEKAAYAKVFKSDRSVLDDLLRRRVSRSRQRRLRQVADERRSQL